MPGTIDLCREFRHNPTEAEEKLWEHLRRHQLSGVKFRRQHPILGYIVDFYCPKARLAIEVDGGVHRDPDQMEYDHEKEEVLAENHIVVMRFWNAEVMNHIDEVEKRIFDMVTQRSSEKRSRN
jgi:very-short-patch-repair endonuclease